jgi:hypothetical protein
MKYPSCVRTASRKSGISKAKLYQSYRRGIGAFYGNRRSVRPNVKSPQQWACARVNKLARLKRRAGYDQDLLRGGR